MTGMENYYIAQLIVFGILAQPVMYITFKHGKSGFMGWMYLFLFCFLRVLGGILTVHAEHTHQSSTAALVVNAVGTSPLLLGIMGVLHEARSARHPSAKKWLEIPFVIGFHFFVSLGLGLTITGVIGRAGSSPSSSDSTHIKIGMAVLIVAYIFLAILSGFSTLGRQSELRAPAFREGTKLFTAVVWSLPFLGARVIYGAASLIDTGSKDLNPVTGSVPLKVCLGLVPEFLMIVAFVVVGIMTRDIKMKKTPYIRPSRGDEEATKYGQNTGYRASGFVQA